MWFMFEKIPSPKSQLRMRIIPRIFEKKFEIVFGHASWDQEKLYDEK
jgi:hypothetical protein